MKRGSIYIAVAGVLLLVAAYFYTILTEQHVKPAPVSTSSLASPMRTIGVGDQTVQATVVETPAERQRGLSGREGLAPDEGMLFIFPADGEYGFWMKDMRFSIDILWLAAEGTIVSITENVSPDTYPQSFEPTQQARYVLELPAGYAAAHSVEVGDWVQL